MDGLLWLRSRIDRLIFAIANVVVASDAVFLFGLHLTVDEPEGVEVALQR